MQGSVESLESLGLGEGVTLPQAVLFQGVRRCRADVPDGALNASQSS